jgi:hypothetical protein
VMCSRYVSAVSTGDKGRWDVGKTAKGERSLSGFRDAKSGSNPAVVVPL